MKETTITIEKLRDIESQIMAWARLLSTSKLDSVRFETRIEVIANLIQIRNGILRLLKNDLLSP